jgi:hypothetical protein
VPRGRRASATARAALLLYAQEGDADEVRRDMARSGDRAATAACPRRRPPPGAATIPHPYLRDWLLDAEVAVDTRDRAP